MIKIAKHRGLVGLVPLLAVVIYLGLTLATIGKFSIWHDESYSATLIDNDYGDIINRTGFDVHPPFYYLVLKTWSLVVGDSVLGLRLLSALCMLGAILLAWRFFRKAFGERAAAAALLAMSVGPFLIRYGQEMRMYGLGALLAAGSTLLLWNLLFEKLSQKTRRRSLIAYVLIMTAAIYTHYFLFFLLAAHGLFVLRHSLAKQPIRLASLKRLPLGLLITMAAPVLLFLPWVPTLLGQFKEVHGAFWIGPLKVETLTSTVINFFSFMQQWELVHWTALYGLVVLVTCSVLLMRWYRHLPSEREQEAGRLVAFLFFVPLSLLVLISLPPLQPAYQDRYLAFYAPFIYGAFGLAVVSLLRSGRSILRLLVVGLAIVTLGVGVVSTSLIGNNQGWRPIPRFTMNELASDMEQRAPEARIISTWLWTFMDAHTTLRNTQVQLFAPDGVGQYGNYSAVHGRKDILLDSFAGIRGRVWIVHEVDKEDFPIPSNWIASERIERGYATAILYTAQ